MDPYGGLVSKVAPSRILARNALTVALALLAAACGAPKGASSSPREPSAAPAEETRNESRILFLGTSLTAGYGLPIDQAFPALVQERLDREGFHYRVVNSGVSGETSAGARRRLPWLLKGNVAVLVLETGANDGLRGQDPDETRANISAILNTARRTTPKPKLLLLGMEAPPNMGKAYTARFRAVYQDLATKDVTFVPFLLQGVAGVRELNQADGIHPSASGEKLVAETVWKALRPLL